MRRRIIALGLVIAACAHDNPASPPQNAVAPTRGAVGDADLRVLLSDLAVVEGDAA